MTRSIEEVMRRARSISHEETRRESEDYLEMVMFRDSLPDVEGLFINYFGPALKPAGREACEEAERVSNSQRETEDETAEISVTGVASITFMNPIDRR